MGFITHYFVLIVNPTGRIPIRWESFRNNLEMLCHPIGNRLYLVYTSHLTPHANRNQPQSTRIDVLSFLFFILF